MKVRHPNRIALLREAAGMRQTDLARAVSVHESQISKLERSLIPMTQDWMYRIAKKLKRDPWELLPEWTDRTPAERIDLLWEQTADDDKRRLLRKYLLIYEAKLRRPEDAGDPLPIDIADEESGGKGHGSKLMEINIRDDNLERIVLYRPLKKEPSTD
jgi:transcriptional regulator with XRE-family HTH domain